MISVEMLTYSCLVAVIAMLVPFFNDVVGLLGALGFWPLTVFLPIQMHLKQAGMFLFAAFPCPCLWVLPLLGVPTPVACCIYSFFSACTIYPFANATAVHFSQTLRCHTFKFISLFANCLFALNLPNHNKTCSVLRCCCCCILQLWPQCQLEVAVTANARTATAAAALVPTV